MKARAKDTKSANLNTFKIPERRVISSSQGTFVGTSTGGDFYLKEGMIVKHEPAEQRRKVALLGSASSSCNLAPFDDLSWDIWNLAWRVHDSKRNDLLFEIHHRGQWKHNQGGTDEVLDAYTKFLRGTKIPTYLIAPQPDIPAGMQYPVDEVSEAIGRKYFASSIGFMLGLLILQVKQGRLIDEVGLWGIDLLCEDEFAEQRPNAEFMLGILQGLGVKISIPPTSALLKCNHTYGAEDAPRGGVSSGWLTRRVDEYQQNHARMLQGYHSYDGAYQVADLLAMEPSKAPDAERPLLERLVLTPQQREVVAERARVFLQKKEEHRMNLCKIDGAIEASKYFKAMAEHHDRNGVIPG